MSFYQRVVLGLAIVTAAGCTQVQPVERPQVHFPTKWDLHSTYSEDVHEHWWQAFSSPQLDALMREAMAQSPDLLAAAERVRQAELQIKIAGGTLLPGVSLSASTGERRNDLGDAASQVAGSSSAGLTISYEADLWGGLAASRSSAQALYRASEFDLQAMRLSLSGAVASAWFQLLALEESLALARQNLEISERVMAVVEARVRNGVANRAEISRQTINLLNQQATLLPLEMQQRQTRAALAVLLGRVPQGFRPAPELLADLNIPLINAGMPAEILVRRPDLARAEAQLQAADANLLSLRSALWPRVSLSATAGLAAGGVFSLGAASESLGWTAALAQTLFDGGSRRAQTAVGKSRRLELVEHYRRAILVALQETEDALARAALYRQLEQSQREILQHAERHLQLTEVRYREGSDDLLTLLDAQRTLFQTRDQLTQARLNRFLSAVDLYKALGGGWRVPESSH